MRKNEKAVLDIIRGVLLGEPLPESVDWQTVAMVLKQHHMEGFLYHAARGRADVPKEVLQKAQNIYFATMGQQIQQTHYASLIFEGLKEAGIPYMPMKGTCLRPLYPYPELRLSCDVDFLFPPQHRERVREILEGLSFRLDGQWFHHDMYSLGAVTVEPHFGLCDRDPVGEAYYAHVWDRLKTDDGILYYFTVEEFYIFLLYHAYKHMCEGGAGIRSVLDLWIFNRAHPSMDRDAVSLGCEKLGMTKFLSAIERLMGVWFDGNPSDEDSEVLSSYIFEGGAYGTTLQGAEMHAVRELSNNTSAGKARWQHLLGRFLLPYPKMRLRYPCLKKLPFLLPLFWVIRWLGVLTPAGRRRLRDRIALIRTMDEQGLGKASRVHNIIH